MSETTIQSRVDSALSILEKLREELKSEEKKKENDNIIIDLQNQVASLSLENERLNSYINTLENRIKNLIEEKGDDLLSPRPNVQDYCFHDF